METILEDLGLHNICWNIDTDDWRSKTEAKDMVNNIMKNLSNGSIILMHDRHEKTYDTTAEVIDKIRAEGYEFVTVGELIGLAAHTQSAAPPLSAPVAAAPANTTLPAPAAPAIVAPAGQGAALPPVSSNASGGASLPAPSAAQATPVQPTGEVLDSSKSTKLPPQK